MTLLDECFEALQGNYTILSNKQKDAVLKEFFDAFPLTDWGRIDWKKLKIVRKYMYQENFINSIISYFGNRNEDIIIVWDEINHPVITCKLSVIQNVIDDITAVSFNTWIFSKDKKKVVEFYHDGEITLGETNN